MTKVSRYVIAILLFFIVLICGDKRELYIIYKL